MLHSIRSIRCAYLSLALLSCGFLRTQAQNDTQLSWPGPPDTARVRFIGFIARSSDIGAERSFLEKLWDAIVGSDEELDFLVQPVGIAVDAGGRIFIADPGAACVHMFDRKEEEYERITEHPGGTLVTPVGIAVSGGRIYVTDASLKQVIVYDQDLDPEFAFQTGMSRPTGIAIQDGKIYIADTGLHRISIFDPDGNPAGGFGERGSDPGKFNFPLFMTARENLFVVDALNHRIEILDTAGMPLNSFGTVGTVQGTFASPKGIALDSDGNIYVADALFDAIQIFDGEGQLLLVVGGRGDAPGQFQSPAGICIDRDNVIYVVDTLNRRVQLFQYLGIPE